jgi:hypothetical protein
VLTKGLAGTAGTTGFATVLLGATGLAGAFSTGLTCAFAGALAGTFAGALTAALTGALTDVFAAGLTAGWATDLFADGEDVLTGFLDTGEGAVFNALFGMALADA